MESEGIVNTSVAAEEANTHIRELAESLAGGGEYTTFDFLCECGCLQFVPLTLADYRVHGAWLKGHERTT